MPACPPGKYEEFVKSARRTPLKSPACMPPKIRLPSGFATEIAEPSELTEENPKIPELLVLKFHWVVSVTTTFQSVKLAGASGPEVPSVVTVPDMVNPLPRSRVFS